MTEPILTPLNSPRAVEPHRSRGPWVVSFIALALAVAAVLISLRGSDGYSEEDTSVLPASDVPAFELAESSVTSADRSLFKEPKDLKKSISTALASTVTIECGESQGTGWAIALEDPSAASGEAAPEALTKFPGRLVTNHHVITECVDDPASVTIRIDDDTHSSYLYSWDPENDLAIVLTTAELQPLELSGQPSPGWWALSVGSPHGYVGSVSIGNVMNADGTEVIATAPMNAGNSGGPLLNAAGAVMGTTTYTSVSESGADPWYVSMALPALCSTLVNCTAEQLGWSSSSD